MYRCALARSAPRPTVFLPDIELRDVRLFDPQGREALRLPLLLATVSPRSLWGGGFEQLTIDRPVLDARLLPNGRIELAGLDFSQSGSSDGRALDWFFSQPELVIRGGTLRWTDEMPRQPSAGATAPASGAALPAPLVLTGLDFVARNSGRMHALRLDATPPAHWGSRFTLMANLRQPFLSTGSGVWRKWGGQLYADFAAVDISQLKNYVPLGADVRAGRGAVRAWADVAKGEITSITSDLALLEVSTQWGPQLPALDLLSLTGRIAAQRGAQSQELSVKGLRFSLPGGVQWHAGDIKLAHHGGIR